MRKLKKSTVLPVSQRQLASYIGVSPTLLNMAEGTRFSRNIKTLKLEKLNQLFFNYSLISTGKMATRPLAEVDPAYVNALSREAEQLEGKARYFSSRLPVLRRQLGELIAKGQEDLQWLHTIDHMLENFSGDKKAGNHGWLRVQRLEASRRLFKSGIKAQADLKRSIAYTETMAKVNKSLARELMKYV